MLDVLLDDIKKILDDFYTITRVQISLYDEDMEPIYHAASMAPVCVEIRKFPQLKNYCTACENEGLQRCREKRKAHVYKCHAGFTEAIIPICENNVIIGYLFTGQILTADTIESVKLTLKNYAQECGADENKFLKALEEMKMKEPEFVTSSINMIEMCASYLYLSQIIKKKTYVLSAQLKEYIDNHLSDDLSVQNLCDKMFMSKTKLYKLAMKTFGMGCSEYVTQKRVEKAKMLLETTDKNMYTIAEAVGFDDANYFTRVFKKTVGVTPGTYKKQISTQQSEKSNN